MASSYLSDSQYANQRKELLMLMNRLRSVGGSWRAGPTSNRSYRKPERRYEAIVTMIPFCSRVCNPIQINVPRDSGICTRCPLECRLVSAPEWACRISIRRDFDSTGRRLAEVSETPFGDLIRNRTEIGMMLRRAQLAVLDSGAQTTRIMRMNIEELHTYEKLQNRRPPEFSRNVVCVDLEGPDLTDVQVIDLPGITQNASPAAIRLVEDMVVDNIRGNCLILVAIPMTDDIENQKAMTLAREQDPKGLRTIGKFSFMFESRVVYLTKPLLKGVLTKPDLLSARQTTSLALWHDVIMGYKHPLRHGYFCTRHPDDEERASGITTAEAREIETEFFASSDPWSTCPEQDRLGTANLISTLSNCLVQMIAETLPKIIRTADTHLEACRTSLGALPEPPTDDPVNYLLTLITEFSTEIKQCVQGSSGHNDLIQKNSVAFRDFKVAIKQTAPGFVAGLPVEGNSNVPNILTDEEGQTSSGISPRPIYLTAVKGDAAETWSRCTEICFEHVRDSLNEVLSRTMEHFFSRFSNLKCALWTYLRKLVRAHSQDCAKYLEAVVRMETATPMTQNDDFLQATLEEWIVKYKDQRAGRIPTVLPKPVQAATLGSASGLFGQPPTGATPAAPKPFGAGTANPAPSAFSSQPPAGANPAASKPFGTGTPNPAPSGLFGQPPAGATPAAPKPIGANTVNPAPSAFSSQPPAGANPAASKPFGTGTPNPVPSGLFGQLPAGTTPAAPKPIGANTVNPAPSAFSSQPPAGANPAASKPFGAAAYSSQPPAAATSAAPKPFGAGTANSAPSAFSSPSPANLAPSGHSGQSPANPAPSTRKVKSERSARPPSTANPAPPAFSSQPPTGADPPAAKLFEGLVFGQPPPTKSSTAPNSSGGLFWTIARSYKLYGTESIRYARTDDLSPWISPHNDRIPRNHKLHGQFIRGDFLDNHLQPQTLRRRIHPVHFYEI
ncbi:P-loop containing nucleoside triphosphate hydrolase protein [Mycena sanguinolenta]|uniref:P-loop containing nucleoside triphosphate hydrolase protein n=1 Tax=Mycena sanguinolenta TaxID=230812 RepID=A0A8H6XYR3_9AGAR|nr:P-loop containing nucleoside triphosphate hydrolase protein [Mycena sanguinolenta]